MRTSQGLVSYKKYEIGWQLFVRDIAILTNGRGDLILTCQEDVIEFDMKTLQCKPKPWDDDRQTKVEVEDDEHIVAKVYLKRGKKWKYIAKLSRWTV